MAQPAYREKACGGGCGRTLRVYPGYTEPKQCFDCESGQTARLEARLKAKKQKPWRR